MNINHINNCVNIKNDIFEQGMYPYLEENLFLGNLYS